MKDFFIDIINSKNGQSEKNDAFKKRHIINIIRFELAEYFNSQPERYTEQAESIYQKISASYSIIKKAAKNGN